MAESHAVVREPGAPWSRRTWTVVYVAVVALLSAFGFIAQHPLPPRGSALRLDAGAGRRRDQRFAAAW